MDDELLTTDEVAKWLKVEKRSVYVYRHLDDNPLPSFKLGGAIRFRRSEVEKWLREREAKSA